PGERAAALARAGADLLGEAGDRALGVEVAAGRTHVLAVRDGERVIAAVASPRASSQLLMYDLRSCLRRLEQTADEPA
ncbi:MAG TPA: hypothetical protein VJ838_02480, partial [Gaiellaceae bacterium]|nr:hypothetical protein [Gaiellaceae bacterium]